MEHQTQPVITSHNMASSAPSRAPLAAPTATLRDVVAAVRGAALPDRRRQDLIAALNTAARVIGAALDHIPADPVLLRRRLAEASPLAHGVTARRWANIRSLVGAAVALAVPLAPSRHSTPLPPAWQVLRHLLDQAGMKPRQYGGLSRLMHFCAAGGTAPEQVDQRVFDDFRAWLQSSLRKQPEETYARACGLWNKLGATIPGWPEFRVERASRKATWTLPWASFSPSFRAEVDSWLDRLAGRDFSFEAPFRPVRAPTVNTRRYQLRVAASALVRQGRDVGSIVGLAELVEFENYKAILRFLIARRDGAARGQVGDIAVLLRAIARHYVKVPEPTLDAMTAVIRRIDSPPAGLTPRNRRRLRAFDDPACVRALLALPERLMREAARLKASPKAARLVQTALAIELLQMAPMRLGNLAMLDLEQHVVRFRRSGETSLMIEPHEVKNGVPLDFPLPAPSVAILDLYLRDYRPLIAPPGSTALFPGRQGKPKSKDMLRQQISETIQKYTGLTVNPHLFRHITAKFYLDQNPGAYEVIRRVLHHRSLTTTMNFYTGLEAAAAVRHFDQAILRLRQEGPQS